MSTPFGENRPNLGDRGRLVGGRSGSKSWERERAVRTCARNAVDAAELAQFLGMLGLSAAEGR